MQADWEAATAHGEYRTSTRGVTLEQEGFIHCSADRAQAADVLDRYYADCDDPLVLLTIDPAKVHAEIKVEGGFPHVYGPLPVEAVTSVEPISRVSPGSRVSRRSRPTGG
jgi:uncharacterized protein (DUF952 family)